MNSTLLLKALFAAGAGFGVYKFVTRPTSETGTRGDHSPVTTGFSSPIITSSGSGTTTAITSPTNSPVLMGTNRVEAMTISVDTQAASANARNLNRIFMAGIGVVVVGAASTAILYIRNANRRDTADKERGFETQLHVQCRTGTLESVKKLLNKHESVGFFYKLFYPPYDINAKTTYNITPLIVAVQARKEDIACFLIEQGCEIHLIGWVFEMAVGNLLLEVVKKLHTLDETIIPEHPNIIFILLNSDLLQSTTTGSMKLQMDKMGEFLVQKHAALGEDLRDVLAKCVQMNAPYTMKEIFKKVTCVNINEPLVSNDMSLNGKTLLELAINSGRYDCALVLLEQPNCTIDHSSRDTFLNNIIISAAKNTWGLSEMPGCDIVTAILEKAPYSPEEAKEGIPAEKLIESLKESSSRQLLNELKKCIHQVSGKHPVQ